MIKFVIGFIKNIRQKEKDRLSKWDLQMRDQIIEATIPPATKFMEQTLKEVPGWERMLQI